MIDISHSFCSCREIQHVCDSEGSECEEYDYCGTGQPAQLGARLHVVSPSYFCPSLIFLLLFPLHLCVRFILLVFHVFY